MWTSMPVACGPFDLLFLNASSRMRCSVPHPYWPLGRASKIAPTARRAGNDARSYTSHYIAARMVAFEIVHTLGEGAG